MLVATPDASPDSVKYVANQIQYIYDSALSTPDGSPASTQRKVHTINHNLGQRYVNVTVYTILDSSPEVYTQVIPQSVQLVSENQIKVTFNAAIDCVISIMGVPGVAPAGGA